MKKNQNLTKLLCFGFCLLLVFTSCNKKVAESQETQLGESGIVEESVPQESIVENSVDEYAHTMEEKPKVHVLEAPQEEPYGVAVLTDGLPYYLVAPDKIADDLNGMLGAAELEPLTQQLRQESADGTAVTYQYGTADEVQFMTVVAFVVDGQEQVSQIELSTAFLVNAGQEELSKVYVQAVLELLCPGRGEELQRLGTEAADSWPEYQYNNTLTTFTPIGNIQIYPIFHA